MTGQTSRSKELRDAHEHLARLTLAITDLHLDIQETHEKLRTERQKMDNVRQAICDLAAVLKEQSCKK